VRAAPSAFTLKLCDTLGRYNLSSAHEQAMRHDISSKLHVQSVCSAVKNWGLPYMEHVTDVTAIDAQGAQVVTVPGL
jgi:hypothetical protein